MFTFCSLLGAQSDSSASQSLLELDGGVKILIDVGWDETFDVAKLKELEKYVYVSFGAGLQDVRCNMEDQCIADINEDISSTALPRFCLHSLLRVTILPLLPLSPPC
jgi:hypothetical protein